MYLMKNTKTKWPITYFVSEGPWDPQDDWTQENRKRNFCAQEPRAPSVERDVRVANGLPRLLYHSSRVSGQGQILGWKRDSSLVRWEALYTVSSGRLCSLEHPAGTSVISSLNDKIGNFCWNFSIGVYEKIYFESWRIIQYNWFQNNNAQLYFILGRCALHCHFSIFKVISMLKIEILKFCCQNQTGSNWLFNQ